MDIRLGTEADADAIGEVDEIVRADERRQRSIARWLGDGQCWVAVTDRHVVAYAALTYTFYERGFVEMLHVARSHRRRGIGLAILNHLSHVCETADIFTSTNQSNIPMQRLLTKAGFHPSGVIQNLDEGDPELVYFKGLSKTV